MLMIIYILLIFLKLKNAPFLIAVPNDSVFFSILYTWWRKVTDIVGKGYRNSGKL